MPDATYPLFSVLGATVPFPDNPNKCHLWKTGTLKLDPAPL